MTLGFSQQIFEKYSNIKLKNIVRMCAYLKNNSTQQSAASTYMHSTSHARGTRWRIWLRHCATSRKIAGSIPDCVIVIFHWHNPSGRTMALRLTQPLTEMNTRNISLGLKADCLEIWGASNSWNPQGLSRPVIGWLYLYFASHVTKNQSRDLTHILTNITYCVELYCDILRNIIILNPLNTELNPICQ